MSFESLKKSRKNAIAKLVDAAEKTQSHGGREGDDKMWKPTLDKAGNGYAVIRFLPAQDENSLPWAQYYDHGFKGPTGRWYIERSLTTLGQDDPVSQMNSRIWNRGTDDDKALVRTRKRRMHYVSNIYIVSDPSNPENEGKVFLFQYGKKIFEKLMDVMQPDFEDEAPINPFDFWDGADFKLKIRQVEGYRNYDKSEFSDPSPLLDGDDKKLKEVFEQLHSLSHFTDPKNFKTYEELYRKLVDVLGDEVAEVMGAASMDTVDNKPRKERKSNIEVDDDDDIPFGDDNTSSDKSSGDDEDEEMMSFFQKLADE